MQYLEMQSAIVKGSRLAYAEQGSGSETMIFLHGMPTSAYLWRKVLPVLSEYAHCYAPDLIGMGGSDKPDIDYSIFDHIAYIEEWIAQLGLDQITFVLHGWGSLIGFYYAMKYPKKVKGLAFYEAHFRPVLSQDMLSLPVQELVYLLGDEAQLHQKVLVENYLVEQLLPDAMVAHLTAKEMAMYRAPFATQAARKPLLRYIEELPIGIDQASPVLALITEYSKFLCQTDLPKCLMYAMPGLITRMDSIEWAQDNLSHLTMYELGQALHYAQESHPRIFSRFLSEWYTKKVLVTA